MVLLSPLVLISSILAPEQAQPASNLGSTVSYYDVEKATFDGSPDFSAPENCWREIKNSVFLIHDSNDVKPDSIGNRQMNVPELNFYTKSFGSDSQAVVGEALPLFKRIKDIGQKDNAIEVHQCWKPQQPLVELGSRRQYFVKVTTYIMVEKRLIGKETVMRKRGFKFTGASAVVMRDDQWYDPFAKDYSHRLVDSRIIAEPKWKRATAEELQNFLWESPF